MIRPAKITEIAEIIRMINAYQRDVRPDLSLHSGVVAARVRHLIEQPEGCALVLDLDGACGVLLAQIGPSMWWPDLSAEILLWWIDPAVRGGRSAAGLVAEFESWAAECGAGRIGATYTGKSAQAFFVRRGYRGADTRMMKDLG